MLLVLRGTIHQSRLTNHELFDEVTTQRWAYAA
jgi:hypothetical protein